MCYGRLGEGRDGWLSAHSAWHPSAAVNSWYNEPPPICHIAHVLVGSS